MPRTITGTTTTGIVLSTLTDNPVTVAGGALVESSGFTLIGGSLKGQPDYNFRWTITNFGYVEGKGANSTGVVLYGGGTINNYNYISGGRQGIFTYYQPATVVNKGLISAYGTNGVGIILTGGGRVTNDGTVFGYVGGVKITGANATVANYGTIENRAGSYGVKLYGFLGNLLTNSASGLIQDKVTAGDARTTLVNNGTILGDVSFSSGGLIQNGSSGSTAAVIDSFYNGITGAAGTVVNYGTITGGYFVAVDLPAGGAFDNAQPGATVMEVGTSSNATHDGVVVGGAAGTVTNLGTIEVAANSGFAVFLTSASATVTNGSSGVASALITTPGFGSGIFSSAAASVTNYATISAGSGVLLQSGGDVANIGAAALIAASFTGVNLAGSADSTLTNTGTISASNPGITTDGVSIGAGDVVNGSSTATAAQIIADPPGPNPTAIGSSIKSTGVVFGTSGTLANYGTVAGASAGVGIPAGSVTNGSAGTRSALIEGRYYGVHTAGAITQSVAITNFGTIAAVGTAGIGIDFDDAADNTVSNSGTIVGAGGTAVAFGAGDDRLIVRAGAVFAGVVNGGGGNNEIDFHTSGKISLAPEFIGFARVRLFAAYSLALKPADLAGLAAKAITVIDGNSGDTVSTAALTAAEEATVKGDAGNDIFVGGLGKDIFTGGAGADTFDFSAAALTASDTVEGGSGDDELVMTSAGTVAVTGVSGVETWRLASGKPNSLRLTTGNFIGTTGTAITVIDGNAGDTVNAIALALSDRTTVIGGSGNDVFIGGAGIDLFNGHAGNDTFRFSAANLSSGDVVKGGDGNDTLFLTSAGTLAAGGVSQIETWRLANGGANKLILTAGNFAGVRGTTITVEGGDTGNTIDAHLVGAGDHAVMIGGAGKDVFTGGPGNDTFRFSVADLSVNDIVKGGGGNDTLFLTSAGTIAAGGVSGVETYRLANGGADRLTLTAGNFAGATGATITVEGGNTGNTVDAHQAGAADHAVMIGGAGKDVFTGGPGNDTFRFSAANLSSGDVVKGGSGNDTLVLTSAGTLAAGGVSGVETYRLASGGVNALSLTNTNFAGTSFATITVFGGNDGNTLSAAGVSAADLAVLVGGAGADILTAGRHARLKGGGGADQFVFAISGSAASPDANTITDFAHGIDKIVFRDAGFNLGIDEGKGTATPQAIAQSLFSTNTNGTFATTANRFAYNAKTGGLFYDAGGSGKADASQRIATLTNDSSLTASDLFFAK